ncbi:MAG: hypothetical protein JXL84_17620 [Deltaproteobacteria bacterium]|nr:hypothetical protein [Deltaproteobacteria bacterium]
MKLKRVLFFLNLLLVGLAVLAGVRLAEGLFYYKPGEVSREANPERKGSPAKPLFTGSGKAKDPAIIIQKDIFGTSSAERAAPGRAEEKIKPTSLGLLLKGTVLGENQASFAIITDRETNLQDVYGVNDFVQGARVVDIGKDRVILSVKGSREALLMADETGSPAPKTLAKTPPRPRPPARLPARVRTTPPQAPGSRPSS